MKHFMSSLCLALLFIGCAPEQKDKNADIAFQKNSETVLANLKGWQNENLDYSMYASDFAMLETTFGAEKDSISLEEMKSTDRQLWDTYDFKLLTSPPNLLPGVDQDTKAPDGSVRHYSEWEVTLPATDSTEAKSGVIRLYESFDFNDEGKISFQQVYGDFTGLMTYLHSRE